VLSVGQGIACAGVTIVGDNVMFIHNAVVMEMIITKVSKNRTYNLISQISVNYLKQYQIEFLLRICP